MVSIDFVWTRSRRDRISVPLGPLSVRPDLRCNFVVHGFMEFVCWLEPGLPMVTLRHARRPWQAGSIYLFHDAQIFDIVTQIDVFVYRNPKNT